MEVEEPVVHPSTIKRSGAERATTTPTGFIIVRSPNAPSVMVGVAYQRPADVKVQP